MVNACNQCYEMLTFLLTPMANNQAGEDGFVYKQELWQLYGDQCLHDYMVSSWIQNAAFIDIRLCVNLFVYALLFVM